MGQVNKAPTSPVNSLGDLTRGRNFDRRGSISDYEALYVASGRR